MYNTEKPYKSTILEIIKDTWQSPYVSVTDNYCPIVQKKFLHPEANHTDGIGTKGVYHWKQKTFKNACIDALAMNLNDLLLMRAIPYQIQNHIMLPEDDRNAIIEIIQTLAYECKKRKIVISGGETSIHNNLKGLEISITMSGFIRDSKPNRFELGDLLIGIESNGLHSNGFTKIREIFGDECFNPEFTKSTRVYYDYITNLNESIEIKGMAHITGGAYTKLRDFLANNADIVIYRHKLKPQKIFNEIYNKGVPDEEMYKTFNCGVGFIFSIDKSQLEKIPNRLEIGLIGEVIKGNRKIIINSMFSDKKVIF